MPLTRSKVKQSPQHPSTSSTEPMDENVVALGGRNERKRNPKNKMPLRRSKVKQSIQHPSTSSTVSMDENVVASGRMDGRKPNNRPCLGEKINPMVNNVVLTILFEYVNGKNLKACRLVCKQWHDLTLPFVRSQFQVRIYGPRQSRVRGVRSFMELISSNTLGIPFRRYYLHFFETTKGLGQQFLRTCGDSAKEIILDWDWEANLTLESVAEILKSTSKLESLTTQTSYRNSKDGKIVQLFPRHEDTKPKLSSLKYLKIRGSGSPPNICPTFCEELFRAAENISSLNLGSPMCSEYLESVLNAIETLGRESMIENMTISMLNDKSMEILRRMALKEKGLKLKKLDLQDDGCHGHDRFMGLELIEIFKDSLIALRVTEYDELLTFPQMPKMKRLHLRAFKDINQSCDNFAYLFPSLEKLHLDFTTPFEQYDIFANGTEPCPSYKSSTLRCHRIKIEHLNRILTIFPTLTFLECQLDAEDGVEIIKKIWTQMTQLEVLNISGTFNTTENMDSLVTGIPVRRLKTLSGIEKFSKNSLQQLKKTYREVRIRNHRTIVKNNFGLPSIRNLKNLRSLTLRLIGTDERNPTEKKYLTDLTAYFGLYALKNLRHLDISGCEFSTSCSRQLVKGKDFINWKFRSTTDQEIIPTEWNYRTTPDHYAQNF